MVGFKIRWHMLRVLIIEFLLTGVIGAVFFRLAWAATKNHWVSWVVVLVPAIFFSFLIQADLDADLIHELMGASSEIHLPSPVLVDLNRFLGWVIGAGLAAVIVAKRKKKGLEDDNPFKDFP